MDPFFAGLALRRRQRDRIEQMGQEAEAGVSGGLDRIAQALAMAEQHAAQQQRMDLAERADGRAERVQDRVDAAEARRELMQGRAARNDANARAAANDAALSERIGGRMGDLAASLRARGLLSPDKPPEKPIDPLTAARILREKSAASANKALAAQRYAQAKSTRNTSKRGGSGGGQMEKPDNPLFKEVVGGLNRELQAAQKNLAQLGKAKSELVARAADPIEAALLDPTQTEERVRQLDEEIAAARAAVAAAQQRRQSALGARQSGNPVVSETTAPPARPLAAPGSVEARQAAAESAIMELPPEMVESELRAIQDEMRDPNSRWRRLDDGHVFEIAIARAAAKWKKLQTAEDF